MGVTRFRDYNLVSQPVLWQAQIFPARVSCNNSLFLNFSNSQIYFYIKLIHAGFCCDSLSISEIITIFISRCKNFIMPKFFTKDCPKIHISILCRCCFSTCGRCSAGVRPHTSCSDRSCRSSDRKRGGK